jgi:hypothetical protein
VLKSNKMMRVLLENVVELKSIKFLSFSALQKQIWVKLKSHKSEEIGRCEIFGFLERKKQECYYDDGLAKMLGH